MGISQYIKEIGRGKDGARLPRVPASARPVVVLPSYNGTRKLQVLTPLLALLPAREGLPVRVHGTATEAKRVFASDVMAGRLAIPAPIARQVEHILLETSAS